MSNIAGTSLRRGFIDRYAYIVAVVILGIAALSLNAVTQRLKVHFKKEAVPLRHELDDEKNGIPIRLGPWLRVSETSTLDPEMLHTLGTNQFVFRDYLDTRKVDSDTLAQLEDPNKDHKDKMAFLYKIQSEQPEAVVRFQAVYYTGLVDTVAHVPERCMIASGYNITSSDLQKRDLTLPDGTTRVLRLRCTSFEDRTPSGRGAWHVAYLFNCNGEFVDSSDAVRGKLQNLLERHGYYAKVELATVDLRPRDPGTAAEGMGKSLDAMADFLSYALPDIQECLPDWDAVKAAAAAKK